MRIITHGCSGEEPGLGPGCCKICLCSCSGDKHISKRTNDQPSSAHVWDVTVSISECPKHKLLFRTKENLAILTFLSVLFFKKSEKIVLAIF